MAFINYGLSFKNNYVCLIDTYNTINSGLINFMAVLLAIDEMYYS